MNKFLIIWIFLYAGFVSPVLGSKVVIQDINSRYDLPKNRVNCMVQDSKGFLWFGMVNGLYKFDLVSFAKHDLSDNTYSGFPELDVRTILEYSPGKLMIGTNKGLFIYNTIIERYDTLLCESPVPLSSLMVDCIYKQKNGLLWIGTDRGLVCIREKNTVYTEYEFVQLFDTTNTHLNAPYILEIAESRGEIWFLTTADIAYYDQDEDRIISYTSYGANSSIMFCDSTRIIQSFFGDGIRIFNTERKTYEDAQLNPIFNAAQVRFAYKDRSNRLWFGITNIGLVVMDSVTQQENISLITNKHDAYSELNSNVTYQIRESSDGAFWLSTEEGINMIDIKPEIFNSLSYASMHNPGLTLGVRSLMDSGEGYVWIGTLGDGLFRFNIQSETVTEVPLISEGKRIGNRIQAIIEDSKGDLWLGTEGDGVIRLMAETSPGSTQRKTINYRVYPNAFPQNTVRNDYVMCLLEDRHHNIWIGTWFGLSLLDSTELSRPDQADAIVKNFLHDPANPHSISHNTIMSILEDQQGNIIIATQAGINKLNTSSDGYFFEHGYTDATGSPLINKKVLDLFKDINGDIWFSTQGGGICFLDLETGIFKEFNSKNGFHDHIVNSISQDRLGIFWLGTNNGLCRFDPQTESFTMYYTEDGLLSNDFFYRSNCQVNDLLFFGGNKGLTWFDPLAIKPDPLEPNLVFTDLRLFNESVPINRKGSILQKHISFLDNITLNYNQNYITLEFTALNYRDQNAIHYAYILEGLESTWSNLKNEQKVTFTNLNPGEYVVKVEAFIAGHRNNSSQIALSITIRPPFWKTIIAYIVYLVLIILIILYTYRYFLNQEKKRHALALERMNAKRIHEMDMMKLQFYTHISHELRTPLTLISAPLETLLNKYVEKEKIHFYYELMYRNVQRLRRLINQLLDMRKFEEGHLKMEWSKGDVIEFIQRIVTNFDSYAERRNIFFTFQTSIPQLITFFDADKLDKVVFNLLSNAFKYTPDFGSIAVKLAISPDSNETENAPSGYYEIRITDSGLGIPEESLPNIFKPFHQVKKNKPIGSAGSGIGLSLAKQLIDLHQGKIEVESEVGKGSSFTVSLPILNHLTEDKPLSFPEEIAEKETGKRTNTGLAEPRQLEPKTLILIVEDNDELRGFLSDELRNNYRILEAPNGMEGLEIALKVIPDLIISDVMMDKMDGIELCRKLKLDHRTSHIPIILLTARHSEEVKQHGLEIGADDYITKPFNIILLQARIRNLIEQRRNLRKLFGLGGNMDLSEIVSNKTDVRFLEKMNQVIVNNLDNPEFGPVILAGEMAMSKMQLYRKVSALTNQTVYNFIRTIRMNKAAQLLVTTDMQVAEVAYSVGFTEASNFTKTFSQHFNQTPSQFVRDNRK